MANVLDKISAWWNKINTPEVITPKKYTRWKYEVKVAYPEGTKKYYVATSSVYNSRSGALVFEDAWENIIVQFPVSLTEAKRVGIIDNLNPEHTELWEKYVIEIKND